MNQEIWDFFWGEGRISGRWWILSNNYTVVATCWKMISRLWGITRAFRRDHQGKHDVGMRFWVTKRDGQEKILNLVGSCPEKVDKLVIDLVRSRIKRWHTSDIWKTKMIWSELETPHMFKKSAYPIIFSKACAGWSSWISFSGFEFSNNFLLP